MSTRPRIATIGRDGKYSRSYEANREQMLGMADQALKEKPDLLCIPETFTAAGVWNKKLTDSAEPLDHTVQQGADRVFILQVGLERIEGDAVRAEARAVRDGLPGFFVRAAEVHRDLPAAGRQRERDLAAETAGGAGDQHGARRLRWVHS